MNNLTKFGSKYYILRCVLSILAGIFLVAFPDTFLRYMVYVIGTFVLCMGIFATIEFFKGRKNLLPLEKSMQIINSAVSIIFGVALLTSPNFFIDILMIIIGILVSIAAIFQLLLLWQTNKISGGIGFIFFVMPTIILIAGLMAIFYPFEFSVSIIQLLGLTIVFYGVAELIVRHKIGASAK